MPQRDPGPSVKDPEMYEALRDEGASKEKAARIANAAAATSRSAVGRKGGEVAGIAGDDLDALAAAIHQRRECERLRPIIGPQLVRDAVHHALVVGHAALGLGVGSA